MTIKVVINAEGWCTGWDPDQSAKTPARRDGKLPALEDAGVQDIDAASHERVKSVPF
jgi:hypothetical protein